MTSHQSLDLLAQAHHIERDYVDIWGNRHLISDDTKRALLGAMGVPCEDDGAIKASLRKARHRPFERFAPVVLVIAEGKPII
ncbi:MAG: 4-alpha-glucanotransferase, partial [Pseudomonadota bacterium]